jgi:hypothetical protein
MEASVKFWVLWQDDDDDDDDDEDGDVFSVMFWHCSHEANSSEFRNIKCIR